jgi:abhydrolase domain-containing protein 17
VYEYLVQVRSIPPEQVVLYGRSLGSGPSCYLAQKTSRQGRSVGALVLHAPFVSVFRVVVPDCAPGWMYAICGDKFRNVDRVRDITCPIFIAHGEKDSIVPFWHGKTLKREAVASSNKAEIFTTPGMHHNYFDSKKEEEVFVDALNNFLDNQVLGRSRWK